MKRKRKAKVVRKLMAQDPDERVTRTAAELIRMLAEADPEGHAMRLGRAYGVGPDVTTVAWKPGERPPVIVLDRIEPGVTPDYCIHGRATCIGCDEWVWLGHETHQLVQSGAALPLCQPCAIKHVPPDSEKVGRVEDHKRKDGPH